MGVTGGTPVNFVYAIGSPAPAVRVLYLVTNPSNLAVTMTPSVTTPVGGSWLQASLNFGVLTISVSPAGLAASATAYMGSVQLSSSEGNTVTVPVNLTVYPAPEFTITTTHLGNFAAGQTAAYSVVVANASATAPATGPVMVTEGLSSGLWLMSMSGIGWNCNTLPTCSRSDSLLGGESYSPIVVTVGVESNAPSPQLGAATLSVPGYQDANVTDSAIVTSTACSITHGQTFTITDVQAIVNQALGIASAANDINVDGVVNALDIQLAVNAVLGQLCIA